MAEKPLSVDYKTINLDPNKPKKKYTTTERRADLLHRILEAGSYKTINTYTEGPTYGCSHTTIAKDRIIIGKYITQQFKQTGLIDEIILKKRWALKKAHALNDYRMVDHITESILKMGYETGGIAKVADKIEVDHKGKLNLESKTLEELLKNKKHAP